jgi:hypothetical protein
MAAAAANGIAYQAGGIARNEKAALETSSWRAYSIGALACNSENVKAAWRHQHQRVKQHRQWRNEMAAASLINMAASQYHQRRNRGEQRNGGAQ